MQMYGARIDHFTTLDDLPKKLHGDREAVRAALLKAGRFSEFDVTTRAIGSTLTKLAADPTLVFDNSVGYPWTLVREAPPETESAARIVGYIGCAGSPATTGGTTDAE
jgi:hypothetical protein